MVVPEREKDGVAKKINVRQRAKQEENETCSSHSSCPSLWPRRWIGKRDLVAPPE